MAIVLALLAAAAYGAADFSGGLASRRVPVVAVVLASMATGLVLCLAITPLMWPPSSAGIAWGAAAGFFGGSGVALLYLGLARGRMSVVAPITGVGAAAVPVVWDLARGTRPGAAAIPGIALALVAVVLVSMIDAREATEGARWWRQPGVPPALGAGLAFGLWFVVLAGAPADAGLWPVVGTRLSSVALLGVIAAARRTPVLQVRRVLPLVALAGALDISANALYLLASRRGLLAVVAVVTSLYPAGTVVLARVVLHERFGMRQRIGMACAAAGVALLSMA